MEIMRFIWFETPRGRGQGEASGAWAEGRKATHSRHPDLQHTAHRYALGVFVQRAIRQGFARLASKTPQRNDARALELRAQ